MNWWISVVIAKRLAGTWLLRLRDERFDYGWSQVYYTQKWARVKTREDLLDVGCNVDLVPSCFMKSKLRRFV